MENCIFIPNRGRVPSAENLPTLLQKPVALLEKLTCVAGVISGQQQADNSIMLRVCFRANPGMDYKKALECFKVQGLTTVYMNVDPVQRFMKIKLTTSKILLN